MHCFYFLVSFKVVSCLPPKYYWDGNNTNLFWGHLFQDFQIW